MMRRIPILVATAVLVGMLALSVNASATPLLTSSAEVQLETWLGMGDLVFANLFTKNASSDTTLAWHAAVDGLGATVSLMAVTDSGGGTFIIGGYNPQSWDSSSGYHVTSADADRTAFTFNLTTGVLLAQKPANYPDPNCAQGAPPPGTPNCGKFQTYNYSLNGPTFGGGHDLNVGFGLNGNVETGLLNVGYEEAYSYGDGLVYYDARGLLPLNSYRCGPTCGFDAFTISALETYTFAPAAAPVPEPGSLLLLCSGLAAAAGRRLKSRREPAGLRRVRSTLT